MTDRVIVGLDTSQLETARTTILDAAARFLVVSPETYATGADYLREIRIMQDRVASTFRPTIQAAHKAHKTAIAAEKQFKGPLADAEKAIRNEMARWKQEEDRKQREEEERLLAQARKEEEERRLAEAERLEKDGHAEAADAVVEAPLSVAVPVVPTTVPKVENVSWRDNWKYRVTNIALVPDEYTLRVPNDSVLGAFAKRTKGQTGVPGVEFYNEPIVSQRR